MPSWPVPYRKGPTWDASRFHGTLEPFADWLTPISQGGSVMQEWSPRARGEFGPGHMTSGPYTEAGPFGDLPRGATAAIDDLLNQLEAGRAVGLKPISHSDADAAGRMRQIPPKLRTPIVKPDLTRVTQSQGAALQRSEAKANKGRLKKERKALKAMQKDWNSLLTKADQTEIAEGVQRHLKSLKPEQLQMFHPARELRATTPNDWLAGAGTGNPTSGHPDLRGGAGPTGSGPAAAASAWDPSTPEDIWREKLAESKRPKSSIHGSGIHESIKQKGGVFHNVGTDPIQGQRTPVMLAHQEGGLPPRIVEGHHRVAAAADINPAMEVPVENVNYRSRMSGGPGGPGHGMRAVNPIAGPTATELPFRRIKKIVPNPDLITQLTKFTNKWGLNALRLMMKIPK